MPDSLFIEFIGDSPTTRVLDYLMTERELDFSITDIAKNSGIGRATLYRIWSNLLKFNMLKPTRVIGRAKLYTLNKTNPTIKKLIELDDILTLKELKKRSSEKTKINLLNK